MISLFKNTKTYSLFAFERNNNFRYPFAKLVDVSTRKEETNKKQVPGSISFVPSVAGLIGAGEVIKDIIK